MIEISSLTIADVGKPVIHRLDNAGMPEYATISSWDKTRIYIIVQGDNRLTRVKPIEVSRI